MSLSGDKDAKVIEAFNSMSRYLEYLLNIDNTYFDGMFNQIYPSGLQLNKANSFDTDLDLTISYSFVSSKIYDKRDDFDIDIGGFPFLNGDIPRALLIRVARLLVFFCSSVSVGCSTPQGSPGVGRNTFLSSPHLCFIIVFICDLFVSRDDPLVSLKTFMRTEQLYVLSHDRSRGRGCVPVKPV